MNVAKAGRIIVPPLWVLFLSACASLFGKSSAAGGNKFQLVILKQSWQELKLGYSYESAWPALTAVDRANSLFTIGLAEMESYHWSQQTITLTQEATNGLIDALAQAGQLKEDAAALKALEASLGWGNPVERALYTRGFVATLNGEPLYGGIFLNAVSQMAIDYPVIRVELAQGRAVLHLLPIHVPFFTTDPLAGESTPAEEIVAPEARGDWIQFPDAMKSAFLETAGSQKAEAFRALIRDVRIQEIVEQAGKKAEDGH
ncbi:MAG: hypothetical protein L0332_25565 [Chloroflexi bacterium]|nr:hypothetical protein [Chloroflexota bacterium]MCI0579423.1 hypothetical protein [Chloroflexota bacterium]MCI0643366.1 hypothetical protein [Chloroflexota bacterium]MCI0730067.1 hypothetical protein [Chloroflexota bacterium]